MSIGTEADRAGPIHNKLLDQPPGLRIPDLGRRTRASVTAGCKQPPIGAERTAADIFLIAGGNYSRARTAVQHQALVTASQADSVAVRRGSQGFDFRLDYHRLWRAKSG